MASILKKCAALHTTKTLAADRKRCLVDMGYAVPLRVPPHHYAPIGLVGAHLDIPILPNYSCQMDVFKKKLMYSLKYINLLSFVQFLD